jgi:hypothetical protein
MEAGKYAGEIACSLFPGGLLIEGKSDRKDRQVPRSSHWRAKAALRGSFYA